MASRQLRPCGTIAAYRRHQRHGERPCVDCLAAFYAARVGIPSRQPAARRLEYRPRERRWWRI